MLERHEIELNKRDQDELNAHIAFKDMRPDFVSRVKEYLISGDDVCDLMNEFYLEADKEGIDLTVKELNDILIDGVVEYRLVYIAEEV